MLLEWWLLFQQPSLPSLPIHLLNSFAACKDGSRGGSAEVVELTATVVVAEAAGQGREAMRVVGKGERQAVEVGSSFKFFRQL